MLKNTEKNGRVFLREGLILYDLKFACFLVRDSATNYEKNLPFKFLWKFINDGAFGDGKQFMPTTSNIIFLFKSHATGPQNFETCRHLWLDSYLKVQRALGIPFLAFLFSRPIIPPPHPGEEHPFVLNGAQVIKRPKGQWLSLIPPGALL
jgi:hypothetical protein